MARATFSSTQEWGARLATDVVLQRVVAVLLPSFAGINFSQAEKSAVEEGLARGRTNGRDLDWSQVKTCLDALGTEKYPGLLSRTFQDPDFMDKVETAYKAELGPQAAGPAGSRARTANSSSGGGSASHVGNSSAGDGDPAEGPTQSNKRTRYASSGSGSRPDVNAGNANGSNPTNRAASSPAKPASASPGAANSPSARAGTAGHTSASAAAQAATENPAARAATSHEENVIRAAPTEPPSLNAVAPPMWWGDDTKRPHMWPDPGTAPIKYKLDPSSKEYQALANHVKSFDLNVEGITRVQNPKLWEQYNDKRLQMLGKKVPKTREDILREDLRPYNLHESLLFHYSSDEAVAEIYDGQDQPLPTTKGTFGDGIYLTDDPHHVAKGSSTGKLFVCAALLGDVLAVPARDEPASWSGEPEKHDQDRRTRSTDKHFDSVVGRQARDAYGNTGPNEFVVYRQSAICPMYIVTYSGNISRINTPTMALCSVPDFAWKSKVARPVANPFGVVAGSSNYRDDGSRWHLFLHTFYHCVLPDSIPGVRRIPFDQAVPAGPAMSSASSPLRLSTPSYIECPITELLLAKQPGLECLICESPLQATGDNATCLVMPCGHIIGHVNCWCQPQVPNCCIVCLQQQVRKPIPC
eukprot:jgi/Mesvir1/15821/Mv03376-RA.1